MNIFLNKLLNIFFHIYNKNKKNKIFFFILFIASIIFFIIYKIRLLLYKINVIKSYSLPAYVVSIGNITSGGTGKTTLSIEAAKYFLSSGYKVALLARGYTGKFENEVVLVSDGREILSNPEACGDEAYLIAKNVPKALVLCGKDRIRSGNAAIKLGANVLILDDGFQYLKLNRNENILIIDSYNPFDNCHLLPCGMLREFPDSITRSTSIIISNSDYKEIKENDIRFINKFGSGKPIAKTYYKINELISLNTKKILKISDAKGLNVIACCGIGNPTSFLDLLSRNEIIIKTQLIYPDHHNFTYGDIEQIVKLAQKYNVENIITTEKDSVKIEELCQGTPLSFWFTKIEIVWQTPNLFEKLFIKHSLSKANS